MNKLDLFFEVALVTEKAILRTVNNQFRQQIIRYLATVKSSTVTKIYVHLRYEQSVASVHLGRLRKAGIVTTKRSGKEVYYSLNNQILADILDTCQELNKIVSDARTKQSEAR